MRDYDSCAGMLLTEVVLARPADVRMRWWTASGTSSVMTSPMMVARWTGASGPSQATTLSLAAQATLILVGVLAPCTVLGSFWALMVFMGQQCWLRH